MVTRTLEAVRSRVEATTERCRACHQPYWAYAPPKTEDYSYRLLGTSLILACLTAERDPAGVVQRGQSFTFGDLPFQIRNAYILEMSPKVSGHEDVPTIVYIDNEAYVWLGAEFFAGNIRPKPPFRFGALTGRPWEVMCSTLSARSMCPGSAHCSPPAGQ